MQEQQSIGAGRHSNGALSRFSRKKKIAAMTVATMAIAGAAFAYWTTTGAGEGDATTAATAGTVTVHQTSTVAGLAPGSGAVDLSGNFTNENANDVYVTAVSVTGLTVTADVNAVGGCDATDYLIVGSGSTGANTGTVDVGQSIDANTGPIGSWGSGGELKIQFNNKETNQNGCLNAVVAITYAAS